MKYFLQLTLKMSVHTLEKLFSFINHARFNKDVLCEKNIFLIARTNCTELKIYWVFNSFYSYFN